MQNVRSCLLKRDRARRRANQSNSPELWRDYRHLRNAAVSAVRRSKEEFFASIAKKIKSPRDFWKAYHSLTKTPSHMPSEMSLGDRSSSSTEGKAEMFNEFFTSCFNESSPSSSTIPPDSPNVLSELEFTEGDVAQAIARLRPDTSTGPDNISARMLKLCSTSISEHLVNIFNSSVSSGKVPKDWKISRITPIFKKGDASVISNYRPISLLSLVDKLLERLIHTALLDHVLDNNILSDKQFGFRPNSSTQEALLSASISWHDTMENGGSNIVVFLDLAKAFDTIQHDKVIDALSSAGVSGSLLDWFGCYLSGRQQFVAIHGAASTLAPVTSGVPQGSILGPLLFLLAFNGIFELTTSPNSSLVGYADDCTYTKAVYSDGDLPSINADLAHITAWLSDQCLRLNLTKVKWMSISRKTSPPRPEITVQGSSIQQVSSFKLLGVMVDPDLSWRSHISSVCTRAKKLTGFIYRTFKLAGSPCLSHLYKSVVLPVLDYSSSIWDPPQKCHITALERTQNFAARVVSNIWSGDSSTIKARLGWPALAKRRLFQKICLCRRVLSDSSLVPPSIFHRHPRPGAHHKNSLALFRPYVRTSHHRNFFTIDVVDKWNRIPEEVASALSPLSFKLRLKKLIYV